MTARFCTAAWVGAAILFVIVAVRQVTSPDFDTATKDRLALLRFPIYYACGFGLTGMALATTIAGGQEVMGREVQSTAIVLLAAALCVMGYDYLQVYQPMAELITPPGLTKTAAFDALHRQSEIINLIQLGLVFMASITLSWSRKVISQTY
jgi:hypothetical protein